MPKAKPLQLVTFRTDPDIWSKFLKICSKKDMTASQVLRKYINLIVTDKLMIMY